MKTARPPSKDGERERERVRERRFLVDLIICKSNQPRVASERVGEREVKISLHA